MTAVALDDRVRVWRDASVVLGGAPWGVLRIAPAGRPFVARLAGAGADGVAPSPGVERDLTDVLLARGIVHPVPDAKPSEARHVVPVDVVVPAYQRPDLLETCLAALRAHSPESRVIVVDDGSADDGVTPAARAGGADLFRHPVNRGPAAARNTGLQASTSPLVAFVDADCAVTRGWLEPLIRHFDDPRVAAVAPRVTPGPSAATPLARYQETQSALDMGVRPDLVAHGAPVGYLPSAALVVRRSALSGLSAPAGTAAFDETMRLGEDVDLVWRLLDAGWLVRYEPASTVTHATRPTATGWARRIFDYGTSAVALDRRHPGRLTPARLSGWNLAIAALVLSRRPSLATRSAAAAALGAAVCVLLATSLQRSAIDPRVAPLVLGRNLKSDAEAAGHLLRREWWPVGWLALVAAWRSRAARAAAAAMLVPLIVEWRTRRQPLDLPRYLALHLVDDAAYGTGVIAGALRGRYPAVLVPSVSLPYLPRRRSRPTRGAET